MNENIDYSEQEKLLKELEDAINEQNKEIKNIEECYDELIGDYDKIYESANHYYLYSKKLELLLSAAVAGCAILTLSIILN